MRLAALVDAIEASDGPVTAIELAERLGAAPGAVVAGLDALRASGHLGPEQGAALDECPSNAACSRACPGPARCPLVIDLAVPALRIARPHARAG